MRRRAASTIVALGLLPLFAVAPRAQEKPSEGPFVEHRVALQLSDRDPERQRLVLSVASNVLKAYGPDKVAVEVVAFGPGIELLRDDNPNASLIRSLEVQGVRFDACRNTIETIERETRRSFGLNPQAHAVEAGVPQLMTLAEHGYTLVRP